MMNYNPYGPCSGRSAFHQPRAHALYTHTTAPQCQKAYMSSSAFRVLLRSIAGGCQGGHLVNEDGVQLYGWRIRERDGSLSAIITDVVESSPHSRRTSVTFDVDHEYAIHRDRYLRDMRWQKNFNLLGYIHSHPDRMTHFSQTDVDTMAEYTRSDMEVMLSGLVTLYRGDLELTMYAVTQIGNQMNIWDLPVLISDEEVNRRLPACSAKPFEQIWREASGTDYTPRFRMLDVNDAFLYPDKEAPGSVREEEEEKKPCCKAAPPVDTSAIAEGAEGVLCGRMHNGTLQLYLQPAVMAPEPQQEAAAPEPVDPPVPEGDDQNGDVPDPDVPDPAGEA